MRNRTTYTNLTTTGQLLNGEGWIAGMYVNSTSSGTVKLYDSLEASGVAGTGAVIFNTITPVIGYHSLGNVHCTIGCYAEIGATLDVTFLTLES